MFGDDLVIWIEPCVARDADMALKWAQMLARHIVTGDELRELSPLGLAVGNFPEPVSANGGKADAAADAEAITEAVAAVQAAADAAKGIVGDDMWQDTESVRSSLMTKADAKIDRLLAAL